FYGTITGAGSYYDPTTLCRGNTYITPVNDPKYRPKRFYYTDAITDNALLFLREHAEESPDRPFFLYMAYTAAHWPMHALPEDIAKYRGRYNRGYAPVRRARFARLLQLGLIDARWRLSPRAGDWSQVRHKTWEARCMEVYAAMIDRMDRGIGRVVDELRRNGWLNNTLILFLQDNGGCAEPVGRFRPKQPYAKYKPMGPNDFQPKILPPMQTRDGRPVRVGPGVLPGPDDTYIAYGKAWANVSNTPFREYKHWVHEGGISTPLIAHWPARIRRRGKLEHQPSHLVDIMATCVHVARATYPKRYKGREIQPLEGVSLIPAFYGRPLRRRDAIYWEHEGNRAVRLGQWKLVAKGAGGPWELYDMERDRTEMHDLAAAYPEKVRELAARWRAWAQRARVKPWPWTPKAKGRPTPHGRPRKATGKRKQEGRE
ncbi:MAG TPA: arylsulfatase, partial [Planctomycetaceae bacterium]|nr:arylsulfatase [Planctomycetaceae bacterium]